MDASSAGGAEDLSIDGEEKVNVLVGPKSGNFVIMENADALTIGGWFAGRLPDGWFTGAPEVTLDGDQIVVVGPLAEVELGSGASDAVKAAAAQGRISRFRESTRRERIWIAREAEGVFNKNVTWGATSGATKLTFNPGGSGRGEGEKTAEGASVKIRRHGWGRRLRGPRSVDSPRFF